MEIEVVGSMRQEGEKPIQGCVVELEANVSNWDSTFWGLCQGETRHTLELSASAKKEKHVTTCSYPMLTKDQIRDVNALD